jgi:hypothetical protein
VREIRQQEKGERRRKKEKGRKRRKKIWKISQT